MKKIFLTIIIAFSFLSSVAKNSENNDSVSRPVTGIYSVEVGTKNVLASYLSPLHYQGINMALSGDWSKALPFNPNSVIMEFTGNANFCNLLNPAKTARMVGFDAKFAWGMSWRKKLNYGLQYTVGGTASLYGGAYYLLRNGNNPVQAMGRISLDLKASVSYRFKIKKLNCLLSENVSIPSLGAFFCPEYGETYYEIYLGNHKGLVHPGWWGNNFCIDNLLSLTFDFGKTAATIGYRFNFQSQWANNLNTKIMTNAIVFGVIPGGIGLKNKSKREYLETISSLY